VLSDDELCRRLRALGAFLRDSVVATRAAGADMATVAGATAADTIYAIDKATDQSLVGWFEREWPAVRIVSEGLEHPVEVGAPEHTVVVDTIDGTRGLMYDKRSAWVLAAVAPVRGTLRDVVAAAMTEIPTTRQWSSDRLSAVRGAGTWGERVDMRTGEGLPLAVRPSSATTLDHGWASFAKFFPTGKALLARFEERLWGELYGDRTDVPVFDDQYLSTGGQVAELALGRDRLVGDLRPLAFAELGIETSLACHPYDICTALVLEEAGGVVTDAWGGRLDAPLDTTTPVSWIGYANRRLADVVAPAVARAVAATFPRAVR
jgi:fructose-1,6-bisphosphatase/inositol monophosphatase family enzyme